MIIWHWQGMSRRYSSIQMAVPRRRLLLVGPQFHWLWVNVYTMHTLLDRKLSWYFEIHLLVACTLQCPEILDCQLAEWNCTYIGLRLNLTQVEWFLKNYSLYFSASMKFKWIVELKWIVEISTKYQLIHNLVVAVGKKFYSFFVVK